MILMLAMFVAFVTGGVEGVSGDSYDNRVACNPNDVSIHYQFQRD
jgi:hypothetical protein